ncbi:hypothetical protein GGR58DRAFT_464533 [Xylaria digitata]|nr:hypothetical protein GGR58DRAFT_464533 [Xylaria digitata]
MASYEGESDGGVRLFSDDDENVDLEERFKEASKEIKRGNLVKKKEIDDFFMKYYDVVEKTLPNAAGNLLHIIVEVVEHTEDIEPKHVELLTRRLVETYPWLLKDTNKDGHNPIYMAIRASKHQLVDYMISICFEDKAQTTYRDYLNEALRMQTRRGETCLHIALKNSHFDPNTTRMLIERANDEALEVQDDLSKTPMHCAMRSFTQCTDARVELISLFINRDLKAIQGNPWPYETFLDLADKEGSSIYLQHLKTREPAIKSAMKKLAEQASQRASAEDTEFDQRHASSSGERPEPRGPRSQISLKDARYAVSAKPIGEQDDGGHSVLDEREMLRQRKKAEEAARLGRPGSPITDRSGGQDAVGQHPGANRPIHTDARLVAQTSNATQQQEPAPNMSMRRSNTGRLNNKPDQEKRPLGRTATPREMKKITKASKNLAFYTKNSDEILLRLKLHYMRTRNAEMAISFLYGTNMDDVQISFDYDNLPSKMLWNQFIDSFGADDKSGLKFDRVLQYVTFPYVEVRVKGRQSDRESNVNSKSSIHQLENIGRKDMTFFFDWLYKKGVRHIIKLSVQESADKVHSDQAIQASVARFIIEQLDWQKTDLDPETILRVGSSVAEDSPSPENPKNSELVPCRQLKQLNLRWSGSNAVLRAWSEPEGLPMLPELQRIYLTQPPFQKTCDDPQWMRDKIKQFGIRLNENRRAVWARKSTAAGDQGTSNADVEIGDIEIVSGTWEERKETPNNAHHPATSAHVKGINSHQWLDSTMRFTSAMAPFWKDTVDSFLKPGQKQFMPKRIEDSVVVALIDDGVDKLDKVFSQQVLEGKSFDFHDREVRPYFSSARGHGTVMASMILRVCPMAKIYPIRLRTFDKLDGKVNIDTGYAAKAIQAALDKKATIISMSWTLPMKMEKSASKDALIAVLEKAVKSEVLMFCSAPDKGKFTDLDFPSGPWRDRFFRIGAAKADGNVFNWTPDDGITYILPGVDVIKDQVRSGGSFVKTSEGGITKRVDDFKYETGSSVATALAAGLAAMIIHCVKASIMAMKTANQDKGTIVGTTILEKGMDRITNTVTMKQAFASLGRLTNNKFIQVWDELDKVSKVLEDWRLEDTDTDARRECVEQFINFSHKLLSDSR